MFTTEIVFRDIASSNRKTTKKRLDGDATSFDWSPNLEYIVKTLEGKGEKEARDRDQRMRRISKVLYCDALSETAVEKGYEGPYIRRYHTMWMLGGCISNTRGGGIILRL